jgi:hypothetical protein
LVQSIYFLLTDVHRNSYERPIKSEKLNGPLALSLKSLHRSISTGADRLQATGRQRMPQLYNPHPNFPVAHTFNNKAKRNIRLYKRQQNYHQTDIRNCKNSPTGEIHKGTA